MASIEMQNKLVRSAAALAAQTSLLSEHAGTLLEVSHVLAAAGHVSEAHSAATQALDLYQRKGQPVRSPGVTAVPYPIRTRLKGYPRCLIHMSPAPRSRIM
jgi:ABC-type branched-subunit amino acid transport system substrate-binding protein